MFAMIVSVRQLMEPVEPGDVQIPDDAIIVSADMPIEAVLSDHRLEQAMTDGLWVEDSLQIIGRVTAVGLAKNAVRMACRTMDERDQAHRVLARVQSERSLQVANMGHELRTPLNAIVGYSDLIRSKVLGEIQPAVYADYVDAIHVSSLHLVSLLDSLLDLIKIQASEMTLSQKPVNMVEVIDSAVQILSALAQRRQVMITRRLPKELPPVMGDERMLRQVLLNLLSNAIKFTKQDTEVLVTAWVTARGELRVEVVDHGPGIPEEKLQVVMQPFKQLADCAPEGLRGTGLGLPLAKALVELHEGLFTLASRVGKGTRAIVTLPAARVIAARPEAVPDKRSFKPPKDECLLEGA